MAFFDRFIETRWAYAVAAAVVLVLALPGLFFMPTMDRDEARFTQATSQMLETGDYVVIKYHNGLRNKKPVGIHWMQALSVGLTSGAAAREIAEYRIPSLIGAMLAAMATLWAGSALFTRRAAFIGAIVLGSCLLLSSEAHIAKTDAAQCGFLTVAIAALAHMRVAPGRWKGVVFWVALAIGVLLKGPIAPMVAGLTIVGLFIWERKFEWARPLLFWPGISLFCIMTIPWFVATEIATSGAFLKEAAEIDLGHKIIGIAEGHKGLPGQHLAGLPLLFWPGTLLLIPGIWLAVTSVFQKRASVAAGTNSKPAATALTDPDAAAWRFVICWLVPSWLVFEIAPTKLFHYTLPLYPALALMAGAAADRWFSTSEWKGGRWISLILFAVAALLLAALPTPWVLEAVRHDAARRFGHAFSDRVDFDWAQAWKATGVGLWPTALIVLATGGTIYAFVKKMPMAMLGGLLACSLVVGWTYRIGVLPNQTWTLSTRAALSALQEICALPEDTAAWKKSGCEGRAPQVVRAMNYYEPSMVFELGGKVLLAGESKAVIPSVTEDNRPAWLINISEKDGRKALDELTDAAAAADRCIRFARRYVMNYSNGDPSILVAAVIEPAGCPSSGPPPELRPPQDVTPELDK
ncbi:MAG: glycosyltransferase family 39 protein [Alphaproteobacteria bacterium]